MQLDSIYAGAIEIILKLFYGIVPLFRIEWI